MLIFLLLMIALASKLYNELPVYIRTETKMAMAKFKFCFRSGSVLMLQFSYSLVAYHSTCAIMGFVVLESQHVCSI